jgi:hypothetical protein
MTTTMDWNTHLITSPSTIEVRIDLDVSNVSRQAIDFYNRYAFSLDHIAIDNVEGVDPYFLRQITRNYVNRQCVKVGGRSYDEALARLRETENHEKYRQLVVRVNQVVTEFLDLNGDES